jgi:Nuclease A inhibitor-like protein
MPPSTAETLALLQAAVADLRWVSETDAPFLVAPWPPAIDHSVPIAPAQTRPPIAVPTPEQLRGLLHKPADCPIATLTVEALFAGAATPQTWHSAEAAAIVQRYQALVQLLNAQLTDLQAFRVGLVNVEIYVIGQVRNATTAGQPTGDWLSVTTQAVET